MKKVIVFFFTIKYPFGSIEPFIQDELFVLSKHFEKIVIIPSKGESGLIRSIPDNCTLEDSISKKTYTFSFINALKIIFPFIKVWFYSLVKEGFDFKYFYHFSANLHHFYNDYAKWKDIRKILDNYQDENSLIIGYDYWLLNSSLSMIKCETEGLIQNTYCRAHGFDLYDERDINNFLPFLKYKADHIHKIFTISKHGKRYLKEKNIANTECKYLGIMLKKGELIPDLKIDVKPLIVSCSGIIPVKRVHLIANAIKQLDFQLTWVHFGDGPLAESIKNIVNSMDKSKICYFPGFMPNANIQSFYAQNNVDIFISASESEGLPVSMMEAQAYGIPILAPELNGIPEIVNEYTGRLFSPNLTALELSKKIESFLKIESFDNQVIKNHFKEHFSAEDNYDKFAIELKESSFQN